MQKQNWLHPMMNNFAARKMQGMLVTIFIAGLAGAVAFPVNAQTQLVSVNRDGSNSGNSYSHSQVISAEGRFVAFVSNASDLVSNDMNGPRDIFVRDLQTQTTTLVSVNRDGTNGGNGHSRLPAISADGRFVAFYSIASDLGSNDTNGLEDVYVRDLQAGTTTLVSVNRDGTNGGNNLSDPAVAYSLAISADGRFVAFESLASDLVSNDMNGLRDIFVRDLQNQTTTLVSVNRTSTNSGNGTSHSPTISADGRFVAFASLAGDLVSNDQDFGGLDVFARDLQNGTTTLVSVPLLAPIYQNSSNNPVISADGRFVAFVSYGPGLVSNDTNGYTIDVYVRDLRNGTMILVSVNRDGTNGGNNQSSDPAISADGRFVVFRGPASDLVSNDMNGTEDVFIRDLRNGTTTLVSINRDGTNSGNNYSIDPVISADGRFVVFQSAATDLVSNDPSGRGGVFVRNLQNGTTTLVSVNRDGTDSGNGSSGGSMISADGEVVAFQSMATDLVNNDTNNQVDIFVRGHNQPPTANAGGPYSVNEAASVTVTASGSDPENGPLTYVWDLDNNGSFETAGQSVNFSAAGLDGTSTSSRTIQVQVTDNGGLTATDQATVNVLNVAPTATFTSTPSTIIVGQSATLAFSNQADPSAADVTAGFTYSYDCTNDGTFEISDVTATSHVCAYPVSGTFTANGRIKDKDGGFTDYTVDIVVQTSQEATGSLIEQVQALIDASILNQGQGHGLIAKLEAAIQQLDNGNTNAAINQLQSFINQVYDFMISSPPILTAVQGQPLIDVANAIIVALSNPAQPAAASLKKDATAAGELPTGFQLAQNSPNPFNPTTTIQFSVPRESYVRLKVYNSFGAEVATLVDRQVAAGTYKVNWDASRLASGFYLYRLETEGFAQTKKLLLMK